MSNYLLKYADDATLLSPQNSPTPLELEMAHVMHWARENKMSLNVLVGLTSQVIYYRPHSQTESTLDMILISQSLETSNWIESFYFVLNHPSSA